jgi:hypothetical protein
MSDNVNFTMADNVKNKSKDQGRENITMSRMTRKTNIILIIKF